ATFLDMFGDPRINSMNWEKESVITYADCIVPARDKPKSFTGSVPWVNTVDLIHLGKTFESKQSIGLTHEEIKEVGARIIPKNSVLMTCVGDLGVISIAETNMVINQQLHSFQCKEEMNNIFLMFVLSFQKKYMYKVASKTTVPYMNKTNCNSIPVIKPPLDMQIKFASFFEKINKIKNHLIESLKELENLFESLSQRAFKGQLDLSKVDISAMDDEKKKPSSKVTDDTTISEEKHAEDRNKIIESSKEVQNDGSYLISALQEYIEQSKRVLSKANSIIKAGSEEFNSLESDLELVDFAGSLVVDHINTLTPWQVNQHSYVERYVKHIPQGLIDKYPNINLFSRREFDYSTMSLEDYW